MPIHSLTILAIVSLASLVACGAQRAPLSDAEPTVTLTRFKSDDARQGVAVDAKHIYAISNKRISKLLKSNGILVKSSSPETARKASITHLNSGVIHDGQLYTAHSNWPHPFIRNSIEVWTAENLKHVTTHFLSTDNAYLSWLDHHQGAWWAAFVEYPVVTQEFTQHNFAELKTRVVKMDDSFRITKRYRFPVALLQRLYPMSNSGASWGPDGCLYLTGHNRSELYVARLPASGDTLHWTATISLPDIEGQGIAWDRDSSEPRLYGIRRSSMEILGMPIPNTKLNVCNK